MGKDLLPWIIGAAVVAGIYFFVLRPGAQNFANFLNSPQGNQKLQEIGAQLKAARGNYVYYY
jgi:hypothetical protein